MYKNHLPTILQEYLFIGTMVVQNQLKGFLSSARRPFYRLQGLSV